MGVCGYSIKCWRTYVLVFIMGVENPRLCLAMADSYVLRGDWLCSGYGIIEAPAPSIADGNISMCVCFLALRSSRAT